MPQFFSIHHQHSLRKYSTYRIPSGRTNHTESNGYSFFYLLEFPILFSQLKNHWVMNLPDWIVTKYWYILDNYFFFTNRQCLPLYILRVLKLDLYHTRTWKNFFCWLQKQIDGGMEKTWLFIRIFFQDLLIYQNIYLQVNALISNHYICKTEATHGRVILL